MKRAIRLNNKNNKKIKQVTLNARVSDDLFGGFRGLFWTTYRLDMTPENIARIEDNFIETLEGTRLTSSTPTPDIQDIFSGTGWDIVSPYGNKPYTNSELRQMDKLIKLAKKNKGSYLLFSDVKI